MRSQGGDKVCPPLTRPQRDVVADKIAWTIVRDVSADEAVDDHRSMGDTSYVEIPTTGDAAGDFYRK